MSMLVHGVGDRLLLVLRFDLLRLLDGMLAADLLERRLELARRIVVADFVL